MSRHQESLSRKLKKKKEQKEQEEQEEEKKKKMSLKIICLRDFTFADKKKENGSRKNFKIYYHDKLFYF